MLLNKLLNDSKVFFFNVFRHFWASFMFMLVYFVLLSLSLMCEVLTRIIIILRVILNFLHLRKGHLLHTNSECSVVSHSLQPSGLQPIRPPVHGIYQATILEWVAISLSRGFFLTQGSCNFCIGRQILYHCVTREIQKNRPLCNLTVYSLVFDICSTIKSKQN